MSNALIEFRNLEAELKKQQEKLEALLGSEQLKKEIAFEKAVKDLMAEYGKSLGDIIEIIDPQGGIRGKQSKPSKDGRTSRSPRKIKRYTNPHTGESFETAGGNHKLLKAWASTYGREVVESWSVIV